MFTRKKINLSKFFILILVLLNMILLLVFLLIGKSVSKIQYQCESVSNISSKYQCWDTYFKSIIHNQGVNIAMDEVARIYNMDPSFSKSCHAITHRMGAAAYTEFKAGKRFEVTSNISYCDFGFYHGYIEELLTVGGKLTEAKSFCEYVDARLKVLSPNASAQCFHGIGHGNVAVDLKLFGKVDLMIVSATSICEQVSDTSDRLYRCASGVYNGVSDFYAAGKYGLSMSQIDKNDPLALCRRQPKNYVRACYGNMKSIVAVLTNKDFSKVIKIVEQIQDDKDAQETMWYFSASNIESKTKQNNFIENISLCRAAQSRLYTRCIEGMATGFLWYGKPSLEYVDAFRFCNTQDLTSQEKDICFNLVIKKLPMYYSKDTKNHICSDSNLPSNRKDKCLEWIPVSN